MSPVDLVDYSDGRPDLARLRALGYVGVIRYLNYRGITSTKKALTQPELDAIHAAGLGVVLNFESVANRMKGGRAYGVADATDALNLSLKPFGVPADRPVYFSADWDVQTSDFSAIDAYLDGAASVLGPERVGGYGSYRFIRHITSLGYRWLWQTFAWSYGKVAPSINLYQHANHYSVAGARVDLDWGYGTDYGAWFPSLPESDTVPDFTILDSTARRISIGSGAQVRDLAGNLVATYQGPDITRDVALKVSIPGKDAAYYLGRFPDQTAGTVVRAVAENYATVVGSLGLPDDSTPFSQADLDAAYAKGGEDEKADLRNRLGL